MMTGQDIRDLIFPKGLGKIYVAQISAQEEGSFPGTDWLKKACPETWNQPESVQEKTVRR